MSVFPVFFISSTPIMLLLSAVLGFWWGFLVVTIGTTIGMLLSFLVGKQIFRDRLHRYLYRQVVTCTDMNQAAVIFPAADYCDVLSTQRLCCFNRWVAGNQKAEAMLLAISEAGTFKVVALSAVQSAWPWLPSAHMSTPWALCSQCPAKSS